MKRAHDDFPMLKLKPYHRSENDLGPVPVIIDATYSAEKPYELFCMRGVSSSRV